jgi:hypothetical protein
MRHRRSDTGGSEPEEKNHETGWDAARPQGQLARFQADLAVWSRALFGVTWTVLITLRCRGLRAQLVLSEHDWERFSPLAVLKN